MMGFTSSSAAPKRKDPVADALRSCRSAFFAMGLVSCVINILTLTAPLFMMQVSDRVLSSQSVPTLIVIGALALGLYIFFGFLDYIRTRVLGRIGISIDAQLSGQTFEICTLLPTKLGKHEQSQNPMRDLEVVRQFLSGPGPSALFDIPWMPFYLGVVYLFHPVLGIMAACGAVCIAVLIFLNEYSAKRPMAELGQSINDRARFLEECRQAAEAVRAMGMVHGLRRKWSDDNVSYLTKQLRSYDLANLFSSLIKTFRFIMQSAILGGGAWLVIQGSATAGVMIAAAIISSRALAPVEQAVGCWRGFVSARQSLRNLRETSGKWTAEIVETKLPLPKRQVSVQGLATAPVELKRPYVQNISFDLQAGQALGVIGQSGSGKTSMVRAILGVNPIMAGSVRFDDAELGQWSEDIRGEFIGYLPQEVQLLDGTVAQNISRFDANASSEDIIAAARLAGTHEMIVNFADGYDTRVGEHGHFLSGGQRQRIGLARALYSNPFVLIMDEPNSNLDAEGEAALAQAILQLKAKGSVVIVIAHRVAALSTADTIMVMENGKCKAIGPKDEMLKKLMVPVTRKAS